MSNKAEIRAPRRARKEKKITETRFVNSADVKESDTSKFALRVPRDKMEALKVLSKENSRSVNAQVNHLINEALRSF